MSPDVSPIKTPQDSAASGTAPPRAAPQVPDHELIRSIGGGSYGEVWLARNVMGTYRAVKVVYRSRFDNERPFEREFSGIQKFEPISRTHDGLVDVLQIGRNEAEGYFYYVMELADTANTARSQEPEVRSQNPNATNDTSCSMPPDSCVLNSDCYSPKTLRHDLVQRGRLPSEECVQLGLSLTSALAHLHKSGLVHRDIKPSNIIFVNGLPKLADIGLVTHVGDAKSFVGTEGFVPPEGPGKAPADIYSLGKVLYEISTGKDRQAFPEPPTRLVEMPEQKELSELNEVILKACDSDPRKRYQTAEEMHSELALLSSGKSVKRLHLVERRLKVMTRTGVAAVAVMVLGAFPYFLAIKEARLANREAKRAQAAEQATKRESYARAMLLAHEAVMDNNFRLVRELLAQTRPFAEENRATKRASAAEISETPPLLSRVYESRDGSSNHERVPELLAAHRRPTNLLSFEWRYLWRQTRSHELHQFRGHTRRVRTLAFSSDGRSLASLGLDGVVKVWDLQRHEERFTLTNVLALGGLATVGTNLMLAKADGSIALIDSMLGREVESRRFLEPVGNLLGGLLALTRESDQCGVVRNVSTCEEVVRLPLPAAFWGHGDNRTWIAASRDGRKLAVLNSRWNRDASPLGGLSIDLWDLTRGAAITNLTCDASELGTLALSPDGTVLVAGGLDGALTFWDLTTFRLTHRVPLHEATVQELAFSPDGKLLASCSADQSIVLWDLNAKQVVVNFGGHGGLVTDVEFSPDGRLLASGNLDGTVRLWDTNYREPPDTAAAGIWPPTRLVFSPDGKKVIAGCRDSNCKVFDMQTLRPTLVVTGVDVAIGLTTKGHAILRGNQRIILYDFQSNTSQEAPGQNFLGNISRVAVSPSGKMTARTSWTGIVQLWDNSAWKEITRLPIDGNGSGDGLSFMPDERTLACSRQDGRIMLWNWASGSLKTFKTGLNEPQAVSISPDGKVVACVTANSLIRVWRLSDGQDVAVLKGHRQWVRTLVFSPDGKTLASCSNDGTLRLWDVALGMETAILRVVSAGTKGTNIRVWDLAFSPDGNTLAAYAGNGTLKVWRAALWEEIAQDEQARQAK